MAEAFPSAILATVLKTLDSPFFQHNNKVNSGLGIQLRDLCSKLELIRDVIYDAELMGIMFPKFFRHWLCELQQILHEIDDLMDEALTRSMPQSGMVVKVRTHLYQMPFNLKLARKMKNFNGRLDGIVKKCYKCNMLAVDPCQQPQPRRGILRYDADYAEDDAFEMIGRDDDKRVVIKWLFDEDPVKAVVWISGEAGVGKTTLCRAVYNDEEVRNHFEVRLWFGPSAIKEFSAVDVWKKIIAALDETQPCSDTEEEDQLIDKIVSLIGKKKMLLVFDCFVPEDGPDYFVFWIKLKNAKYRGTKIIGTSTNGRPYVLDNHYLHELNNDICEENSWSIFKNAAGVRGHDREEWIQDLGRKIVRRCVGHPALLKSVGTLLNGKYSEDDRATWEYFSQDFDFSAQYHRYIKMSSLHYLFQVFHQSVSYLSLFSKDDFKLGALMNQFAANGFTNLSDKARQRFERYFFMPILMKDDWDEADRCWIDRSKDEIMQLAGVDCTNLGWEQTVFPKTSRHVSISRPSSSTGQQENIVLTNSLIKDDIHRRSLLFLGKWHPVRMSVQNLNRLASNLRYLRVLDLQDLALKELPNSIGKLIHLRYLDLSRNDFRELTGPICRLKNLQTLMLVYCDKLIKIPGRIKNLLHLKHLEINMCLDLTHFPSRISQLTCLQRLDRFVVGPREGGLRYLEHLDNLNGHLTIELPRQWKKSVEDAKKANLERKEGLTTLEFKWKGIDNGHEDNNDYNVLEKLKPYTGIESLIVLSFGGTTFPSWITALGSLTEITISHCKRCKMLPPFHGFPKLKSLTLTYMMNIEYLQDDINSDGDSSCVVPSGSTHFFPSLYELSIGCMPKLNGWSRDLSGLLRSIKVNKLEIWECPRLKVMHRFCVNDPHMVPYVTLQDVCEEMLRSLYWGDHKMIDIISIKDMVSLPNNIVTNFPEFLTIEDCNQLQMFWTNKVDGPQMWIPPPKGFHRLHHLSIAGCCELKHLSGVLRHLIELEYLKISKCSEELDSLHEETEDGMPWIALQKLKDLKIEGFEDLEAIPEGFRHLPKLTYLEIKDCKSLRRGVDSLPKVKQLHIISCPRFIEELKRECSDVSLSKEEVNTQWPPRAEQLTRNEVATSTTS